MDVDYRDNAELYEEVEGVPGEQAMFELAAALTGFYARERYKQTKKGISILDLCCGTAQILRKLPALDACPLNAVTGVDISGEYIRYAGQQLWERVCGMGSDWYGVELGFVQADAVLYDHGSQVDLIIASSAYHHIEDGRKLEFLANVKKHLKKEKGREGAVLFCENLIGDYEHLEQRELVVRDFYGKRIQELEEGGISGRIIPLLKRVMQYELDREYEWKHSYRMFMENLRKAGLEVLLQSKVWPKKDFFEDKNVGDFVFLARAVR